MPLGPGISLPDYLTAPISHHGLHPAVDRTPRGRWLTARTLAILARHNVPLAAYTATDHCVSQGAHVDSQDLGEETNVILDLELPHFDHQLNPRTHPGYPALRASRVAEACRWPQLFLSEGWQVRAVHETTPGRLGYVLTRPSPR